MDFNDEPVKKAAEKENIKEVAEPIKKVSEKEEVSDKKEVFDKKEVSDKKKNVVYEDGIISKPILKEEKPKKEVEVTKKGEEDPYQQKLMDGLSNSSAQRNMGVNLKNKGLMEQAIEKWREAIRINPDDFKSLNYIAETYKEKGLLDESAEAYKNVIRINPKFAPAHYALGFDYSARGLINNAIGSFENFVKYASSEDAELVNEVKRMIEHLRGQVA